MKAPLLLVGFVIGSALLNSQSQSAMEWHSLFDGKTTGWRGFRSKTMPDGWKAIDGALVRTAKAADIVTTEQFDDFELSLEWKVAEGGNSGIFYRATEEVDPIWAVAPEFQVLDNARHRDGRDPLTSAGSCYALYAPAGDVTRPVGEWNEARIIAKGNHVEHWMNGTKLLEYEVGSQEWTERVTSSKFKHPRFGRERKGHIGLQDHGDMVWYRNIRIRAK